MSYIFVLDEDKLTEERWNNFISGKDCLFFHKKGVNRAFKMNLEDYGLDYADRLCNENIDRLNRLSASELKEIFHDNPGSEYLASSFILYVYKPSEIKKRLDDYVNQIHVGDVVLFPFYGNVVKGLVTKCEKGTCSDIIVSVIQKDGTANMCLSEECKKTGEHYDSIDEFMKGE